MSLGCSSAPPPPTTTAPQNSSQQNELDERRAMLVGTWHYKSVLEAENLDPERFSQKRIDDMKGVNGIDYTIMGQTEFEDSGRATSVDSHTVSFRPLAGEAPSNPVFSMLGLMPNDIFTVNFITTKSYIWKLDEAGNIFLIAQTFKLNSSDVLINGIPARTKLMSTPLQSAETMQSRQATADAFLQAFEASMTASLKGDFTAGEEQSLEIQGPVVKEAFSAHNGEFLVTYYAGPLVPE